MKIEQDVLGVLALIETDGLKARIVEQLDRKLYTRVNKVLEACGGKWSRGDKAHVFREDARPLLDAAIVMGEVTTSSDIGFFPTPPELAQRLVQMAGVEPVDCVLEPSAGTGALVDAVVAAGGVVHVIERDPAMRRGLVEKYSLQAHVMVYESASKLALDFLTYDVGDRKWDRVVMNPPFCKVGAGDHLDHVAHAMRQLRPGGTLAAILPSGVVFREDRRHREFREFVVEHHGVITGLPPMSFKGSGTGVNTVAVMMTA